MELVVKKPPVPEVYELTDWPVWESEPAEFDRYYDKTEVALFTHGSVDVTFDGRTVNIGAGDLVTFPKGMHCTWRILQTVRKHFQTVDE